MSDTEEQTKLRRKLNQLTKKMDTEGLHFLIEQAGIINYNAKIIKKNSSSIATIEKSPESKTGFTVEAAKDKSSFILINGNSRKFLTRSEMRELVKVSGTGDTQKVFSFLKKERSDILKDWFITSSEHNLLIVIMRYITSKYKTK